MTKFILSKKIDNEWYTYGTYTEKNIDTLCDAYSVCKRVAEDVHVTVTEDTGPHPLREVRPQGEH